MTVTTTQVLTESGVARAGKRIRGQPVRINLGELTPNNVGTLRKLNQVLFPIVYSDRFYRDALNPEVTPEDYSKLIFYQDLAVGNIVCRLEPLSTPAPTSIGTSVAPELPPSAGPSSTPKPGAAKEKDKLQPPQPREAQKLYIMTLGVLAAYRNQGLATKLLSHVLAAAEASHHPVVPSSHAIKVKPPTVPETSAEPADKKAKKTNGSVDKESKKKADDEKEDKERKERERPVIHAVYLHVQVGNEDAKRFYEKFGFKVTNTIQNYFRKIEPRDAWVLEKPITGEKAPST